MLIDDNIHYVSAIIKSSDLMISVSKFTCLLLSISLWNQMRVHMLVYTFTFDAENIGIKFL